MSCWFLDNRDCTANIISVGVWKRHDVFTLLTLCKGFNDLTLNNLTEIPGCWPASYHNMKSSKN